MSAAPRNRELCRLAFGDIQVAARLTTLANAVAAMRVPIRDAQVLRGVMQNDPKSLASVDLGAAWSAVRGQLMGCIATYQAQLRDQSPPRNAMEALRIDSARYACDVICEWLSALDAERAQGGGYAALQALHSSAEALGRNIVTKESCPADLAEAVQVPNQAQLLAYNLVGTIYWLNVDGGDLVVLELLPQAPAEQAAETVSTQKESV